MRVLLAVAIAALLNACTIAPTKTVEADQRDLGQVIDKTTKPLALTENTVVLDTRSSFDFGLNHIPNSRRYGWQSIAESTETAEPMRDRQKAAMRLALLGLVPTTPVVIVGYGQGGHGEEGRLALDLLALGFKDVQVSQVDYFRKVMTPNENPPVLNEKPWDVVPREDLRIGKQEFEHFVHDENARNQQRVHIIDVRSDKEFLGKDKKDIGATNIEWKYFYTKDGRPDPLIKAKLAALGIKPEDKVLLACRTGVRSSAATYALRALGFTNAQSLTGGLSGL